MPDCHHANDDELYCHPCPKQCQCKGNAQHCSFISDQHNLSHIKSLTFENTHLQHSHELVDAKGPFLVYLGLGNTSLECLHHKSKPILKGFTKLLFLHLGDNKVTRILAKSFSHKYLMFINISNNHIVDIDIGTFSSTKSLKFILLSGNYLKVIKNHFFQGLVSLQVLDLDNNPIIEISQFALLACTDLMLLQSDWFMVCLVAPVTTHCTPMHDSLSSCQDLLSTDLHRFGILFQSVFAFVANVIFACMNIYNKPHEYVLFIHLNIADGLMGVYLGIIAGSDLVYKGSFRCIVSIWHQHGLCKAAALTNFLSSQMSLLILLFISFDRAKNIASIIKKENNKKLYLCLMITWVIVFGITVAFFISLHFNFIRIQNNLCLIFGISGNKEMNLQEIILNILFVTLNTVLLILK